MKHTEEFAEEIEAIKIAIGTVHYSGGSVKNTFFLILKKYIELYDFTADDTYLKNALLHMHAFFEMGFSYEENSELFNLVLKKAKVDKKEVFPKRCYNARKVRLNKSQVRNMIRRWSPSSYHTLTISEVVEDIINKVKNKENGCYFYHSNNNPQKDIDDVYELFISDTECFFYDIEKKLYYTFVENDI